MQTLVKQATGTGLGCDLPFNEVLYHGRLDLIVKDGRMRRRSCFGNYRHGQIRFSYFERNFVFIKRKLRQTAEEINSLLVLYWKNCFTIAYCSKMLRYIKDTQNIICVCVISNIYPDFSQNYFYLTKARRF